MTVSSRTIALTKRDFKSVFRGRRILTSCFDVRTSYNASNVLEHRIAVNASKKIGNAVARNLAKRRLRALARSVVVHHKPSSWLFVAKPMITDAKFSQLLSDFEIALRRHKKRSSIR